MCIRDSFLCIGKTHSQSFYDSYKNLTSPTLQKVDSIIKKTTTTQPREAAKIAHDFSVTKFREQDYTNVIYFTRQEVNILHKAQALLLPLLKMLI